MQIAAPVHHSPSEKNTQRPEANHLIVEYPEDKHRFTAYPDHFFLSLIITIRQKKNKAWDWKSILTFVSPRTLQIERKWFLNLLGKREREKEKGVRDRESVRQGGERLDEVWTLESGRVWEWDWDEVTGGWSGTQVGIGKENKLVLREGPWVKKIWISNFPFGDREILVNSWKRNVFNLFCELTRFLRVWPGFMRFWWFSSFASVSTRFMGFNS